MQSRKYIPIPVEQTFTEVYISLKRFLWGGYVVEDAWTDWIRERADDFDEKSRSSHGFVRYVITMPKGVLIGFEPWATLLGKRFRLHFKTSKGLNGVLYFELVPKYKEKKVEW